VKITRRQLRQIIKEELSRHLVEALDYSQIARHAKWIDTFDPKVLETKLVTGEELSSEFHPKTWPPESSDSYFIRIELKPGEEFEWRSGLGYIVFSTDEAHNSTIANSYKISSVEDGKGIIILEPKEGLKRLAEINLPAAASYYSSELPQVLAEEARRIAAEALSASIQAVLETEGWQTISRGSHLGGPDLVQDTLQRLRNTVARLENGTLGAHNGTLRLMRMVKQGRISETLLDQILSDTGISVDDVEPGDPDATVSSIPQVQDFLFFSSMYYPKNRKYIDKMGGAQERDTPLPMDIWHDVESRVGKFLPED
jgi:hypothetical protein